MNFAVWPLMLALLIVALIGDRNRNEARDDALAVCQLHSSYDTCWGALNR